MAGWNQVGIYVDKRRKLPYLVRWYGEIDLESGKPRRYSKSFRTRAQAETFKAEKMAEIKKAGRRDRAVETPLSKLIDDYMRTKRPSLRPAAIALYDYATKRLLAFFGPDKPIASIGPRDADLFFAAQSDKKTGKGKLSGWTRSQILTNCRSIFKAAIRWKLITENPFGDIKKPKKILHKWHHLKPTEYLTLLEHAPDLRWKAFYALGYTAGLRFGELFSLTWSNVDFEKGVVRVENRAGTPTMPAFRIKDCEARIIPIPEHTVKILLDWQTQAPEGIPYILLTTDRYQAVLRRWKRLGMADEKWENKFMVNNVRRSMKVHFRRAEITLDGKFAIHTLRKSFGQNGANAGVPIKTLQYLMGHSDEKTTLTFYAQVDAGQAAMLASATDRLLADAGKRLDAQLTRKPVPSEESNHDGNRDKTINHADNVV